MRHPHGYVYWDMPSSYSIGETHPDLLRLTAELLLYPWFPSMRTDFEKTRSKGRQISLSFSAGIDSTAAMLVMPQSTLLGYHRRSFDTILDHRNADRLLQHLQHEGRQIIDVPSNHELIRTYYDKQIGFSSDFAASAHLILLADYHDIGALGFGTPIDNTYLSKGRKYRVILRKQITSIIGQKGSLMQASICCFLLPQFLKEVHLKLLNRQR